MRVNRFCAAHYWHDGQPCPYCRIAELEALVQMRTEANKHKQARIAELERAIENYLSPDLSDKTVALSGAAFLTKALRGDRN